jgi:hypothetical protein
LKNPLWLPLFVFSITALSRVYAGPIDIEYYPAEKPTKNACMNSLLAFDRLLQEVKEPAPLRSEVKALANPEKVLFKLFEHTPKIGWQKFAIQEYGEALGTKVYLRLLRISPQLVPLLASPGIVNYLDDFEGFSRRWKAKTLPPLKEIYRAFRAHLGSDIYYRGLALTPSDFARITSHGILPRLYAFPAYISDMEQTIQLGIRRGVAKHEGGVSYFTLSITKEPLIALTVARREGKITKETGIFLFEMELPRLEVFEYGPKIPYPAKGMNERFAEGEALEIRLGFSPLRYPLSPRVESFVVGGIETPQFRNIWMAPDTLELPHYPEDGPWTQQKADPAENRRALARIMKALERVELPPRS